MRTQQRVLPERFGGYKGPVKKNWILPSKIFGSCHTLEGARRLDWGGFKGLGPATQHFTE